MAAKKDFPKTIYIYKSFDGFCLDKTLKKAQQEVFDNGRTPIATYVLKETKTYDLKVQEV